MMSRPELPSEHRATLADLRDRAKKAHKAGDLAGALALHREALQLMPQAAGVWYSAALLANEMGDQEVSLPLFERAARLDPALLAAMDAARRICVGAGLYERAQRYSRLMWTLQPSDDLRIALTLTVPAIQPSVAAIVDTRHQYEQGIDQALQAHFRIDDPFSALGMGAFFLAYHGENDCELQAKAAQLLARAMPFLSMTAAHCMATTRRPGKIRVGFISRFFSGHSIGKTTLGLVEQLSRTPFEVVALRITPSPHDAFTDRIAAAADRMIALDSSFLVAREQIAALELDVLFYQDIGMEPMSYLLAFARLAPVQCVSFGHPNTTGIPTMDYFISNDLYETEDSPSHYTERLFLLENLPTLAYYYKPRLSEEPIDRAEFGLGAHEHAYVCAQTLFKVHPEFDALIGGILERDPLAVIIFIRGQHDEYTDLLSRRFSRTLAGVAHRIRFLPRMALSRFLRLLAVADVSLDTLHFNGMNSSLEAFAVGTPVVTLPTRLQRGRHTQAMYRAMGITDGIASNPTDYIDKAVRLGTDREYALHVRALIRARSHVLFENRRVVEEFERFFLHAVHEARGGAAGV